MSISTASLPSDVDALQAFAIALLADNQTLETTLQARDAELRTEIASRDAEIYAQSLHIEKLKIQLALLRRDRFGQSSEKMEHEIDQLELLISDLEEGQAESEEVTAQSPIRHQVC
jgi:transposase